MGDNGDGSSSAAHGALTARNSMKRGFFSRLFGQNPTHSNDMQIPANGALSQSNGHVAPPAGGMLNLNRVRLQEVAITRVDIVSVPVDISLEELVGTFRTSGLTRLPVYADTLDTPLGFVHLKDLALKHGFATAGARSSIGECGGTCQFSLNER